MSVPGHHPEEFTPVAPLREAFERSGYRAADVARELGWFQRGKPDGGRVRRVLGLRPWRTKNGRRVYYQEHVSLGVAERLAGALGLDPREVGL